MLSSAIDDAIFDAGLHAEAMAELGPQLSAVLGTQGCWIQRVNPTHGEVMTAHGFDMSGERLYVERFYAIDPWLAKGMTLSPGKAHSLDHHIPVNSFLNGEFYTDYMRERADYVHCMGAHFHLEGQTYALSFQRALSVGPFDEAAEARFDSLLPSLRRAFLTTARLQQQADHISRLELAQDGAPLTILADRGFGLVWINHPIPVDAPVRTTEAGGQQRIDVGHGLGAAIRMATQGGAGQSSLLRVGRWAIEVDPVRDPPSRRPLALIRVRDTAAEAARRVRDAAIHYGLTAAEERLCASLLGGLSPQDHSDLAGTMISTTRSHLKSLMAKMGVTRQAEVVSVLASMRG
ncbi:helix-turn-helix transcriptional regulator [Sphingomonas montanisoli]|uniref:Helix-turn-helix transcriptional regulator n=1 Tax=Sphingomonas montanisoli TaxID=2606412 RepID=A0A5D9C4P5_9SPHN|nr:helix-turn-helix transcriptional regulator [Sphingomonas montanisoli]TZG26453.1 helix-turn-helix transcriptional regulator [Sphingomonas montanisoli]